MVHRSMENLKLDKRLAGRRGWIEPEELERQRESLPDVEDKAERVAVAGEAAGPSGDKSATSEMPEPLEPPESSEPPPDAP